MRFFLYIIFAVAVAAFLSSCGGNGDLGSVNGVPVTTSEYLEVFNNLPADMQVGVLEPGGRMELMNRVVRKRMLLTAWEENPTVSQGWEDIYRTSMLADSMFSRIASSFDYQLYIDSLIDCGFSGFNLRVVLLDDSLVAVSVARQWNSGVFENAIPSLSAPWGLADGSSYRSFNGPVERITETFLPLLDVEKGIAHVLPMYGEWCVCVLDLVPGEWIPDDGAASLGLMNAIGSATSDIILSKGITALAGYCALEQTTVRPAGTGGDEPVVVIGTDTLTTSEILSMMNMADSANFAGEVPAEVAFFSPPEIFMTTEVTLWFYVKSLGQRYALAMLAEEQGIAIPAGALDYARAESVVRVEVLEASIPDSASVAEWFSANSQFFVLPERRSILLGYTESAVLPQCEDAENFMQLASCQTVLDENGELVPTNLLVEEGFGDELGAAVFQAESGEFSGPVMIDEELAAWFEVVEIVPEGVVSLEEVYPQAALMASSSMFAEGFESFMSQLNTRYSVTVDTAAVREIDLWGGTQ